MKKFLKWFCLFIIYGFIIAVLQANNASDNTITLCSATLLVIIFLLWKIKRNKKEIPQENHTETLNKDYRKSIKTSLNNDDVLERYTNGQIENEIRIMHETLDLISNSKNIDTVLGRIQLGYDSGFITNKDELQINAIKRCYQILLDNPTPKDKTKRIEKYIDQINDHKKEFSLQVNQFVEAFIQIPNNPINLEIKHDLPFDEDFLNTVIEDGKTIKEHMQEDLEEATKKDRVFEQKNIDLKPMEKQFVSELFMMLNYYGLDENIVYERMSNKSLNFTYKDMQIGRIKINCSIMWMQILHPIFENKPVDIIPIKNFEEAKSHISDWIKYVEYLKREEDEEYGSSIKISSVTNEPSYGTVRCPKCGSTSIVTTNKKLSVKRAIVGTALINPLAGAVGAVTSKKMYNVCQNCGHTWKI